MKTISKLLISQFSAITFIITVIILVVIYFNFSRWKNHDVIAQDTISYYAYLPSILIFGDPELKFIDKDKNYWEDKIWYNTTPNGKRIIKMAMGTAYCYLPFFLIAHAYAFLTDSVNDGYSLPYKVALVWSCFFYGLIGIYYLRKILRRWFYNEVLIGFIMIIIVFGTNLFNYLTYNNAMSHVYSFALINAFIWYTDKWHQKATIKTSIIIGVLAGWIFLIRPTNIIIVLMFIFYGWFSILSATERIRYFAQNFKSVLLIILFSFILCIPQLIYWKTITGNWIFYSYTGEYFYFDRPKILEGLFSWRKGWFIYTPVMITSVIGLYYLRNTVREIKIILPILFGLLIYITFSWWCWWYGGSFGQRTLVDWYGILSLPMAALLLKLMQNKVISYIGFTLITGFVFLNLFQHMQYRYESIHFDSMSQKAYFYNFGKIKKKQGLDQYFVAPDYEKAKNGIKEYYWQ